MRLQVIDPALRFACQSCTRCCEQPWRTLIEAEKIAALDAVDWGAEYPALAGRTLYRRVREGGRTVYELAKGQGVRCLFLDSDGLCIIHKKLGYQAKPDMCRQFPFFPAHAWEADYVSANFGCKAIQGRHGPPATEQSQSIAATVPVGQAPVRADKPFILAPGAAVPQDAAAAIIRRLERTFDDDGAGAILARLAAALRIVERAIAGARDASPEASHDADAERAAGFADDPAPDAGADAAAPEPFESPAHAPLESRMLLAATMFPDALPPDSTGDMGLLRRLALVPKLMALAQLRGVYASRLLGRNVRIDEVLARAATLALSRESNRLLGHYLRSRVWQRFPGGTRLPLYSAIHQHVLDVNAVVFYSTARAMERGRDALDLDAVEHGLMLVEFHLANQPRLYTQVLKGRLRSWLASPRVAWASLRMIRTAAPHAQTAPCAG